MTFTIVYYIDSRSSGGAEQVLYNTLSELDHSHWHPVLAYHPGNEIAGFIERIKELQVDTLSLPEIRNFRDIRNFKDFAAGLRSVRPRIFHANLNWPLSCTYGIIAAYLAGIETIVATQHLYKEIQSRRQRLMQRMVSLVVDRYIAVSHDVAHQLKKDIFFGSKVIVVHNGIRTDDYEGQRAQAGKNSLLRPAVDGLREKTTILTVGRLVKQKGYQYLLKAIPLIPGAVFIFTGDGPERDNIERGIKELNIGEKVRILGYRNDIPELLSACDIFVLPSLFEGHPLSIMEAMAACKPVIASDIKGVDEIIINGVSGFLVPPGNPEALASAIRTLMEDRDLAGQIAAAGKERVESEFSAEKMVQGITNVYCELIRQKKIRAEK